MTGEVLAHGHKAIMKKGFLNGLGTVLALMAILNVHATDITTGYSFSSGEQNVTHTKLNNAVNLATINTGFYTDKSATTTPAATDLALIYAVGDAAFRKVTLANLFLANTALITGQVEDTEPSSSDFVLTYDVSGTALKKAKLLNLVFENDALIVNRTNWNTPDGDNFYLGYNGDWNKTARSNLWYQFWNYRTAAFTNLATHTAPTNSDAMVLYDSASGTNRQIPLINLFSNSVRVTALQPTNVLTLVNGTTVATTTLNTLSNYFRTNVVYYQRFTTNIALSGMTSQSNYLNAAHGLGGTPQQVTVTLLCTTADLGYEPPDEVAMPMIYVSGWKPGGYVWVNTTNIGFSISDSAANFRLYHKTTGAEGAITAVGRWSVKINAVYFTP